MNHKEILNLPDEDRKAAFEVEKQRMYAVGKDARVVHSFLKGYIKQKREEHFKAFAMLPRDSGLDKYQAVHNSFLAVLELEKDILGKIKTADRLAELTDKEETETNI